MYKLNRLNYKNFLSILKFTHRTMPVFVYKQNFFYHLKPLIADMKETDKINKTTEHQKTNTTTYHHTTKKFANSHHNKTYKSFTQTHTITSNI